MRVYTCACIHVGIRVCICMRVRAFVIALLRVHYMHIRSTPGFLSLFSPKLCIMLFLAGEEARLLRMAADMNGIDLIDVPDIADLPYEVPLR